LAPGWKWPDISLPSKTPNGNEVRYEEGYATAQADSYWFCSCISRATDSKLSESERQEALKNALTIRSKYFYTTSLAPESKPPFEQMLRNAENGNMDEMKQYFEINCKGPQKSTAHRLR
jgi:hypothetical protein